MPRISKKTEVLKAALTIIENEGVHAVTYDALALSLIHISEPTRPY